MIILNSEKHKIETSGRLQNKSELERAWRDDELLRTDSMLQQDRPDYNAILTYRSALRDWPASASFPNVRPTL